MSFSCLCSTIIQYTLKVVVYILRYSSNCHQYSYALADLLPAVPDTHEGYYIG